MQLIPALASVRRSACCDHHAFSARATWAWRTHGNWSLRFTGRFAAAELAATPPSRVDKAFRHTAECLQGSGCYRSVKPELRIDSQGFYLIPCRAVHTDSASNLSCATAKQNLQQEFGIFFVYMGCGRSKISQSPDAISRDGDGRSSVTNVTAPAIVHSFGSEVTESVVNFAQTVPEERSCGAQHKRTFTQSAIPSCDVDVFDFDGSPRESAKIKVVHDVEDERCYHAASGTAADQPITQPASKYTTVTVSSSISSAVSLKYLLDEIIPRTEELAQELGVTEVSAGTFWEWVVRPVSEDAGNSVRRHAPAAVSTRSVNYSPI